jgi:DNA-directed RNA polymerase I, II, and III subunit RPABC2
MSKKKSQTKAISRIAKTEKVESKIKNKDVLDLEQEEKDDYDDYESNDELDGDVAVLKRADGDGDGDGDGDVESEAPEEEEADKDAEEAEEVEKPEKNEKIDKLDGDEDCMYNFFNNGKTGDSDEDLDEDGDLDEELEIEDNKEQKKTLYAIDSERKTKPYLTKYERVHILGFRAKQLSLGAKPMIKNVDNLNAKEIARLELINKKMPFLIKRDLPDGTVELCDVNSLEIVN